MGIPSEVAPHIRGQVERGEMVIADYVHLAILAGIQEEPNWVLEGFPRSIVGARFLAGLKQPPNVLAELMASRECILRRAEDRVVDQYQNPFSITRDKLDPNNPRHPGTGEQLTRRKDDQRAVVEARLGLYDSDIKPSIEEFVRISPPTLRVIEIDTTELTPETVLETLMQRIFAA